MSRQDVTHHVDLRCWLVNSVTHASDPSKLTEYGSCWWRMMRWPCLNALSGLSSPMKVLGLSGTSVMKSASWEGGITEQDLNGSCCTQSRASCLMRRIFHWESRSLTKPFSWGGTRLFERSRSRGYGCVTENQTRAVTVSRFPKRDAHVEANV